MIDLNPALAAATAKLRGTGLDDVPRRSGATLRDGELLITYLGREHAISLPDLAWRDDASLRERVIILHYLAGSTAAPPSGELIDFRAMPGGHLYYAVFEGRVHRPFLKAFGKKPGLLPAAAKGLNGVRTDLGEFSFAVPVFPRITVHVVLYPGDDELPSSCKLLFDSTISACLSTEDVVVVSEDTVRALAAKAA